MSDQYVGEIRMFAGNYAPEGWMFCDGAVLPINQYEMLFSLIGKTYGGDGQSTFALPDLRGRIPVHMGTSSAPTTYALGQKGGVETVTLTSDQLPAHTHPVAAQSSTVGTVSSPNNAFWATSTVNQYANTASVGSMNAAAISSVGGNQSHENVMPFLALSFIIAVEGLYPSQN